MDCKVTKPYHPIKVKTKTSVPPPVRKMSKIPQLSKIPVPPVGSKIPIRGQNVKKILSPKISVLDRKLKSNVNIIKPVITKRSSISFKEFNISKAGTKPVVKRKSIGKTKNHKPVSVRQVAAPLPGRFSSTKRRQSSSTALKRDSALPDHNVASSWECQSLIKNDKKSLKEMQEELIAEFEPSEFYKNQILNNKEITLQQLGYSAPLKDKRNSRDPAEVALEQIQRMSVSKKSKVPASREKENFYGALLMEAKTHLSGKKSAVEYSSDSLVRRCTWAPGYSPSSKQPRVDPYEAAMARIKSMSISKTQSPIGKLKGGATFILRTPIKMTAYDIAMQQISSLKKAKESKLTPVRETPKPDAEEEEKIEEGSPVKGNLETAFANLSPKNAFKARSGSIYRPLQNLQTISPARPNILKHRLTDISEHSENENTSTISRSFRFSRYSQSSACESSRDNTPQNTSEGTASFSSLKLPIIRSFVDQCNQDIQSTPHSPLPCSKTAFTSVISTPSSSKIHMPVPVSAYTSKPVCSPVSLFEEDLVNCMDSDEAPIHTPLLLKRMARSEMNEFDDDLGNVKQSLKFEQIDLHTSGRDNEVKWEPRYSSYFKHIPMKVKMEEFLADQECALIMSRQDTACSQCRASPVNPLSVILTKGDSMHFVPVNNVVSAH